MDTTAIALSMLFSLPPAYVDENEAGREARMQTIAQAIGHATSRAVCEAPYDEPKCSPVWKGSSRDLVALVVTKGWWESRYARNVHEGNCASNECDAVKDRNGNVIHRARSPWQIQRTAYSEKFWAHMVGTDFDSTRNAAWVAVTILSDGRARCKSDQGALAWYATGRCTWKGAKNRFYTFQKLTGRVHY